MLKKLLIGAALCAISTASMAADLPSRKVAGAPAFAATSSWAGAYGGIVASAAYGSGVTDDQWCWVACTSQTATGFGAGLGLTLGYNLQNGALVYGLEGDFSGTLLKPKKSWYDYDRDYGIKQEHKVNSYATLRGRVGVALGSSLIYTTAGLAVVSAQNKSVYYYTDGTPEEGFFKSQATLGFAAGVGLEHMIDAKWSVKAEYLYVGTQPTSHVIYTPSDNATGEDNATFTNSFHSMRMGVNYKF